MTTNTSESDTSSRSNDRSESLNPIIDRRGFLATSAIVAGGMWMTGFIPPPDYEYRILSPADVEIMDTLADCIIPPDDFPGGREAGATRFIDYQLGRYLHRSTDMYRAGLPALNEACRGAFGEPFTGLDDESKIRFLSDVEAGRYDDQIDASWGGHVPSAFFNTMRDHCMMAFYGHPRHGGNRKWISYHMLELPVYMRR